MEKSEKGVKVIGFWVSPFVHRVKWGLKLKGVEYEYIEEDIFKKTGILSQLNPVYGKVPVLVHDGNPLPESAVILEYLDDTWRHAPLLPLEAYERSQTRFWARFADEKVIHATWIALCSEGEGQERAVKVSISHLEKVEEMLGGGRRFFGGETIGYLDLMLGFIAYMLPVWEEIAAVTIFDDSKFPNLAAWKNHFLHHPVIKADIPSKADMFTYFQWRSNELKPLLSAYANSI